MSTVTVYPTLVKSTFNGHSGSGGGAVSVPGLKVGDRLIWLQSDSYLSGTVQMNSANYFEIIITVDDQIQQVAGSDLSTWTFNAIFIRGI